MQNTLPHTGYRLKHIMVILVIDNQYKKFQTNRIDVLVATSAFGMGVNKKDVWMVHWRA